MQENPQDVLTPRELQVFHLLGDGYNKKEISEKLNLRKKTVDVFSENIKSKFRLESTQELVRLAIKWIHIR